MCRNNGPSLRFVQNRAWCFVLGRCMMTEGEVVQRRPLAMREFGVLA